MKHTIIILNSVIEHLDLIASESKDNDFKEQIEKTRSALISLADTIEYKAKKAQVKEY